MPDPKKKKKKTDALSLTKNTYIFVMNLSA